MQKKIKNRYNKAFTLPEVLMTLGIIGIVAIMTIPALTQNLQHRDTVVRVQKYQEVLNSAIKRYANDNYCVDDLSKCDAFVGDAQHIQAWNALKSYFSLTNGGSSNNSSVMYKWLNGNDWGVEFFDTTNTATLADGSFIKLLDFGGNCSQDRSRSNNSPLLYTCAWFLIDINGHKNPNQVGRDVFAWYITKQGVYPVGMYDDTSFAYADGASACSPSGSNTVTPYPGRGEGCTAKVLKENAVNY
ncbi:MAG: hypothetical protein ACD_20C00084G0028 [uncultured bacterium]|nr:MAG: hypothetical protein ACD_20C00084G0028 [uncultured bacterium]HBH19121.1 hypothetical protein [Cyanobacteria bacterium UBA9579]